MRSLLDLEETTKINAELAEALIESMYLYGDGRLEINFRFKRAIEPECSENTDWILSSFVGGWLCRGK